MNINKFKDFTKKYGFYMAVGAISLGAIAGVYFTSTGTVRDEENLQVYAEGEPVTQPEEQESAFEAIPEDLISKETSTEEAVTKENITEEAVTEETSQIDVDLELEQELDEEIQLTEEIIEQPVTELPTTQEDIKTSEEEILSETVEATNTEEVVAVEEPFFAEGDTLLWPVEGAIIVPYTDDTTKHWLSTALNQTMRTYGVCISAEVGTAIKAPATAKVVDIIEDATTLDWYKRIGHVGQLVVLDHGNGYQTHLGVQGGKVDKSLLGQTIEAGAVIATVGEATGPFVDMESSVYMQVRHNEEIIDPTAILDYQVSVEEYLIEE